ncbi:MAG: transposase [Propionibacteriaceae bacterium]|nr:transposase [Propionibacteriaceae bacterium]
MWRSAWEEFTPFSAWDVRSGRPSAPPTPSNPRTNQYRWAINARGHFPNDQAAQKHLHLVTRSLEPTGRGKARSAQPVEGGFERIRHRFQRTPHPLRRQLK